MRDMMLRTDISEHRFPLMRPFITSRFTLRERICLRFTLHDSTTHHTGCGEASPLEALGTESLARTRGALTDAGRILAAHARTADGLPAQMGLIPGLPAVLEDAPAARFAVECALWDLRASQHGTSIAALLREADGEDRRVPRSVPVNCVIAGGDVASEGIRLRNAGFTCFKLKVGALSPAEDIARVRTLREVVGADARIRLDANGAWSGDQAMHMCTAFAASGIEYIEQPVGAEDRAALLRLRRESPVPVAVDEAAQDLASARTLLTCDAAAVYVIKPMAAGGLHDCRTFALEAAAAGRDVVFTSLLDGWIGRQAVAQLAASLVHCCTRHHGLATGRLFAKDFGRDVIREGHLLLTSISRTGTNPSNH